MKKFSLVIAVLLLVSIAGCKSDNDVLATYKGGEITRGDFYKWLIAKRYKLESLIKNKQNKLMQKDKLEQMILEKITVKKAIEEGFDKTKEYLTLEEMATEGQLVKRLYDIDVRDKATFSEDAVKIRQILLKIKDYTVDKNKTIKLPKADIEKEFQKSMEKAADIIKKLDSGEDFAELAKKQSDDFSKSKGGEIGFVIKDMMQPELTDVVFSMKPGEYTKKPIRTDRGVYIIKVEDRRALTEKNIDEIITDKGQAMMIRNGMLRKYAEKYIDNLMTAKDVIYYEDKALSKNKQAVLFKVGDKSYTIGDFEKRLELKTRGASKSMPKTPEITGERRKGLAKSYFKYAILKRAALEKGIDKDPEYIKEVGIYKESILAREYSAKLFESDITVPMSEMLDEYNKNKDKRYYKMEKRGKNNVKKIESFASAKDRIERNLLSRKRAEKKNLWKAEMLKEFQVKIDESELEGE